MKLLFFSCLSVIVDQLVVCYYTRSYYSIISSIMYCLVRVVWGLYSHSSSLPLVFFVPYGTDDAALARGSAFAPPAALIKTH